MPKLKSKGAVKKRFRPTKTGKLKSSRPSRGHQHAPKNGKQSRLLRKPIITTGAIGEQLKRMLGG